MPNKDHTYTKTYEDFVCYLINNCEQNIITEEYLVEVCIDFEKEVDKDKDTRPMGEKIKEARLKLNMNQVEFAEKVGVSQSFISQLEKSLRYGDYKTIQNISNILGIEYSELTDVQPLFVRFTRNCKALSIKHLNALNEIVLGLLKGGDDD